MSEEKRYIVIKIDEDIDFGCEERKADEPVMAVVTLKDEVGNIFKKKFPDDDLYKFEINEGDCVIISDIKGIRKVCI